MNRLQSMKTSVVLIDLIFYSAPNLTLNIATQRILLDHKVTPANHIIDTFSIKLKTYIEVKTDLWFLAIIIRTHMISG